jgi:hypothetical protein
MLRDYFKKAFESVQSVSMALRHHDVYNSRGIKGEVFWELRDSLTGEVRRGRFKNVVTLDASVLIARLMRGTGTAVPHQCEPNFGGFALAVGTGDVSWNPMNPPSATVTQRSLYNEIARKRAAETWFVAQDGTLSGVPTNVVDFSFTFAESEAVGPLTEMGILGGDVNPSMAIQNPVLPANGTYDPTVNVVGLDTLCNYLTFPVINKPSTSTLSWVWRLTF